MWLLRTGTLNLKYFADILAPGRFISNVNYAILSHRWEDDEVTFDDISGVDETYKNKKGWTKILKFCDIARKAGYEYVWVDTCCIDKRSSAELSEAINSMYNWYNRARICYAYLFDVWHADELTSSTWFTRSWTLQELLAPSRVTFLNALWQEIGTKGSLAQSISAATNIPNYALQMMIPRNHSIAQRMSWASKREATRSEDIAYSLLGIFGISMPLLYGEGSRAFQRLQEEIMRNSNDLSIFAFAWSAGKATTGILAGSPDNFVDDFNCGSLILPSGYTFNNAGVDIVLDLEPASFVSGVQQGNLYTAYLHYMGHLGCRPLPIVRVGDGYYRGTCKASYWTIWNRHHGSEQPGAVCRSGERNWILRQSCRLLIQWAPFPIQLEFTRRFIVNSAPGVELYARSPQGDVEWSLQGEGRAGEKYWPLSFSLEPPHYGIIGYLSWARRSLNGKTVSYILCFGYDFRFQPVCLAFRSPITHCENPLAQISHTMVMNRYSELLSYDSEKDVVYDASSGIYATKGKGDVSIDKVRKVYMAKHSIWVKFSFSTEYWNVRGLGLESNFYNCVPDPQYSRLTDEDTAKLKELLTPRAERVGDDDDPFVSGLSPWSAEDPVEAERSFAVN